MSKKRSPYYQRLCNAKIQKSSFSPWKILSLCHLVILLKHYRRTSLSEARHARGYIRTTILFCLCIVIDRSFITVLSIASYKRYQSYNTNAIYHGLQHVTLVMMPYISSVYHNSSFKCFDIAVKKKTLIKVFSKWSIKSRCLFNDQWSIAVTGYYFWTSVIFNHQVDH